MFRKNVSEKDYKQDLVKRIAELKKKHNAIIIVHNYQRDEVQDIADISGDSLALSEAAVRAQAKVIVFCGVEFMAETASILNPDKTVLLPVKEAGCPLADMITAQRLREEKVKFPDAAVVCYVNSTAEVKAESDLCCTSSNAVGVVKSIKNKKIIFVPDRNLGSYVQSKLPEKEIILWPGYCSTHAALYEEDILRAKKNSKDAEVIVHPECNPGVVKLADQVFSTGGMLKYVKTSPSKKFIIGTESGLLYTLRKNNPDKEFILPSPRLICPSMKLTTLGWVYHALETMQYEIKVPPEIAAKAIVPLKRMLEVSGEKSGAAIAGT